jgi:hypothetical protein
MENFCVERVFVQTMSSSFALCVLWMIVVAEGSFVYVSENGTTTTPCGASPAAACASIHLAVNMTHDNDSILLRAGDSFRVTQPLIVTAFNVSIDSYGAAAGSRATLVGDAATNAVFLFSQSFALANLNFALDHFDLYTTVIFCNATSAAAIRVENVSITQFNNALTAMRVRNHNQPPSASLCNRLYCAMIQMVPAGDFNVSLRQVEFSSANQLYAPFNSKLVYVGVGENRSATVLLDDVAAHHLTANSAMFELQCAAGASCRGEFNRVAIENSLASIVSDGVVSVVSHENSTMAVQFADCLFRNISSRVGGGLVRLTLSSMASNITMSNCSFIDNVGDQMQFTGGVLLTAGFSANTANMFALTVVDCTFSHNPRNRTVVGGGALSAFVSVVFLDSCVHGAVVVRRSLFQNGGGSALHVRPTANDCDQDTYRRTESILIEDCRFLNNLPGSNGVVLAQTSCLTSAWTMDVRRSSFLHNKAWTLSRGAPLNIVIDTESQIGFRATIDACLFVGNVAGDRSGAISLTQSSPGDLLMVPVTIQVFNCSLADNRHRGAGGSEQIVVDFAVVQLSGSVVVASSVGDDDVMDLASFGTLAVWTSNSAFSAINSSFQCAPGRSIAVEKEQSSEFNSVGNVDLVCTLCPVSTYNLAGAILNYNATGIVVPTEPFCLDCPIGSRMQLHR